MKKHLLLLSLACIALNAIAQNSIPNGNFETWNTVSYDYPQGYPFNSNYDVLYRYQSSLPFNVVKTTPAYHGNYAVKVSTTATATDTAMGYFISTNPKNGNPENWTGGMAYTEKPTGITGFYKYNKATGDSAIIFAVFSKGGVNIGTYMFTIGTYQPDFVQFNFTFNPPLAQAPDSVIFAATSSNIMVKENGVAGSILIIDDVSFTGVTNQPAKMNGDFETWDNQSLYQPSDWYNQGGSDQGNEVSRTTDAAKGDYAIELKTYLGTDQNNNPKARAAQIATGYYPRNCRDNCNEMGGSKFTNKVDTLAFWYKYAPMAHDTAQVYINFKKNGSSFMWAGTNLFASSEYKYVEIPFNLWETPDTAIVNIQSSLWADTLVASVGSDLIIDEVHFKSQPLLYTSAPAFTSVNEISIFPNPSDGKFRIHSENGIEKVTVYNMAGKKVYLNTGTNRAKQNEIDLTKFQKGVYFIEINDGRKIYTEKVVIH